MKQSTVPLFPVAVSLIAGIVIGLSFSTHLFLLPIAIALAITTVLSLLLGRHRLLQTTSLMCCVVLFGLLLTANRLKGLEQDAANKPCSERIYPNSAWNGNRGEYVSSRPSLSLLDHARNVFLGWRQQLLERYRLLGARDDSYAVMAAMTLGDKSALDRDLRDVYSITGASHVLALSGLHLGILYMLLSRLTLSHRRRRVWSQVLLVCAVWAFVMLVGMPVSVVRSAFMITIFALFSLGHRPNMSVNLLSLTVIILLVIDPLTILDVGFQLSFMAVLSILVCPFLRSDDWQRNITVVGNTELFRYPTVKERATKVLQQCLLVSVAAQLGVAPLIAFYFGRFSTWFLLTNLIVLPAAYVILAGTLIMMVIPAASIIVIAATSLLNRLLTLMTQLPLASIDGLHPSVAEVVLVYVCIALFYVFSHQCQVALIKRERPY